MNKRLNLRIALILLMLTLVVIIPVYAQGATPEAAASPEPTATVEVTSEATAVLLEIVTPTVEVSSALTAEATSAATVEATQETTVEAGVLPTSVPPETHPVAGVPNESEGQLSSTGVVIGVLLIGLAAVGLVAFSSLMRGNVIPPME